jgi:hypothetical protein
MCVTVRRLRPVTTLTPACCWPLAVAGGLSPHMRRLLSSCMGKPRKTLSIGNISGAHETLVDMVHILNLIHQSYIQRYSHILGKTTPPPWSGIFANNPMSPNLSNIIGFEIDESDLICALCAPMSHVHWICSSFHFASPHHRPLCSLFLSALTQHRVHCRCHCPRHPIAIEVGQPFHLDVAYFVAF